MKHNIVFVVTTCRRSGPIRQLLNLIKNLNSSYFESILITLYEEPPSESSMLAQFLPYIKHKNILISKGSILLGKTKMLKEEIDQFHPDVIHTCGVFPDYAISKMGYPCHVTTIHNFMYDDYPSKYGHFLAFILIKLQLYAFRHAHYAIACSKSLSDQYYKKLRIRFPYIQNGVDISKFFMIKESEREKIKEKLDIPKDVKVLICTGNLIPRKNQLFCIKCLLSKEWSKKLFLVLLGDGTDRKSIEQHIGYSPNFRVEGFVENIAEYLQIADIYISCSKSEGLPYGAMEAMAVKVPVLLSDIPAHKELFEYGSIGRLYKENDQKDFCLKLEELIEIDLSNFRENALLSVQQHFSAKVMSEKYQQLYKTIIYASNSLQDKE